MRLRSCRRLTWCSKRVLTGRRADAWWRGSLENGKDEGMKRRGIAVCGGQCSVSAEQGGPNGSTGGRRLKAIPGTEEVMVPRRWRPRACTGRAAGRIRLLGLLTGPANPLRQGGDSVPVHLQCVKSADAWNRAIHWTDLIRCPVDLAKTSTTGSSRRCEQCHPLGTLDATGNAPLFHRAKQTPWTALNARNIRRQSPFVSPPHCCQSGAIFPPLHSSIYHVSACRRTEKCRMLACVTTFPSARAVTVQWHIISGNSNVTLPS